MRERYPDADVLAQRGHWDDATRRVVMDRVHNVPAFEYFDEHRRATLEALCERVIPQADRPLEKRVPIAPWIDQRCKAHAVSGFRFDDMPPDEVAWEWALDGLDQTAQALFGDDGRWTMDEGSTGEDAGRPAADESVAASGELDEAGLPSSFVFRRSSFVALDAGQQDAVLKKINQGDPPGEIWQKMPARRWWVYVALRQICGFYYSHPYAWDQIGFGGPAYPRGYFALNNGAPEPWEAREAVDGRPTTDD